MLQSAEFLKLRSLPRINDKEIILLERSNCHSALYTYSLIHKNLGAVVEAHMLEAHSRGIVAEANID